MLFPSCMLGKESHARLGFLNVLLKLVNLTVHLGNCEPWSERAVPIEDKPEHLPRALLSALFRNSNSDGSEELSPVKCLFGDTKLFTQPAHPPYT